MAETERSIGKFPPGVVDIFSRVNSIYSEISSHVGIRAESTQVTAIVSSAELSDRAFKDLLNDWLTRGSSGEQPLPPRVQEEITSQGLAVPERKNS